MRLIESANLRLASQMEVLVSDWLLLQECQPQRMTSYEPLAHPSVIVVSYCAVGPLPSAYVKEERLIMQTCHGVCPLNHFDQAEDDGADTSGNDDEAEYYFHGISLYVYGLDELYCHRRGCDSDRQPDEYIS